MYPSQSNANPKASTNDLRTSKFETLRPAFGEINRSSMDSSYQSVIPSAPLLPSCSFYGPTVLDMDPPSYSSVIDQPFNDRKNLTQSSSGGTNLQPYPPALPHIDIIRSTSGLGNQPPYPTGDHFSKRILAVPTPEPIRIERPIGFTVNVTRRAAYNSSFKNHESTMTRAAINSYDGLCCMTCSILVLIVIFTLVHLSIRFS